MIHSIFLLVGWILAWRVQPFSRNALLLILLWPWPVAAHLVYKLTGTYPRWTPPL